MQPVRWGLESVDLSLHRKIPGSEIQLQWLSDYYDGMLNGAALHRGRLCWFEYAGEVEQGRRYLLFELSDAEIVDEEHWQAEFVAHVGDHWRVGGKVGERGQVRPQAEHAKFYEPYSKRGEKNYSGNRILGWFEQ